MAVTIDDEFFCPRRLLLRTLRESAAGTRERKRGGARYPVPTCQHAPPLWCDCHLDFTAAADTPHHIGEIGLEREQAAVHFARSMGQPATARQNLVGECHHSRIRPCL